MTSKGEHNSHRTFTHDSLDSLGYDWERIGDPAIPPRFPLKIYLPQTTEDVSIVLDEALRLGQRVRIRSKGHSSNDLVLEDRGVVLVTEKLAGILDVNPEALTATVRSAAPVRGTAPATSSSAVNASSALRRRFVRICRKCMPAMVFS